MNQIPNAAAEKYENALKRRVVLEKQMAVLQVEIDRHDSMLAGMEEIMSVLESASGGAQDVGPTGGPLSRTAPSLSNRSSPNKEDWSRIIEWMGPSAVDNKQIFKFCQENGLQYITKKQITNWLNNSRISGKLKRINSGVYKRA